MNRDIKRNFRHFVTVTLLQRLTLLCSSGTLMQTFLLSVGFSADEAYIHATIVQAVGVLSILLCSGVADKGNIIRRTALVHLPITLTFLLYLPLCFSHGGGILPLALLLGTTVIQQFSMGIRTVFIYKLPYYVFTAADYAKEVTVECVFSAFVSAGVGKLFQVLSQFFSYSTIMAVAFITSAVMSALCAALYLRMKVLFHTEAENHDQKGLSFPTRMVKHPLFYLLLIPNFLRGFVSGVVGIIAIAAIANGYNDQLTSDMVTVEAISLLVTSLVFGALIRKLSPRWGILIGSLLFLAFPILLVKEQPITFLIAYSLVILGRNLVDVAVPAALMYVVPVEIAGHYHAWRMALWYLGSLVATATATSITTELLFIIALVGQLISGAAFFFLRIMKPDTDKAATEDAKIET